MSRAAVRIVKVGGSLFDWPELGNRLWEWLQRQPPAANYLVPGGGALADVIRHADARHQLGDALSHALCLQAMGLNGQVLRHLLQAASKLPGAAPERQRRMSVLDVQTLLSTPDVTRRVAASLPETWQVTSDSIAAYLAEALGATELVLLKSASLPGSRSYEEAVLAGLVDEHFPAAAAHRSMVRVVNLRTDAFREWILFATR